MQENIAAINLPEGVSLELRSKEVSEAMGNIPSWIFRWGLIILTILFAVTILLLINIRCTQTVPVSLLTKPDTQKGTVELMVLKGESGKFKTGRQVTIIFGGNTNPANKDNTTKATIIKKETDKDHCLVSLELTANRWQTGAGFNLSLSKPSVIINESAFEKIFGSLF